jgi:D-xylonolactonase
LALNRDGRLVLAGSGGLYLWRGPTDYQLLLSDYDSEPLQFNDILAAPNGQLLAGTLYWGPNGMEKTGKLYCIAADRTIQILDDDIELSNGLGLSPDNQTLYYADSARRRIYAYDFDPNTGRTANRRIFVQVPATEGIPDGLTVDAEGFVWSAQWYGSQVVRYDPDGMVERRLAMPVKQVSSLIFGGPHLTDLYITTAGAPWPSPLMPPGYEPEAGSSGGGLYRLRLDIQGKPDFQAALR